jgi:hypothetical protein
VRKSGKMVYRLDALTYYSDDVTRGWYFGWTFIPSISKRVDVLEISFIRQCHIGEGISTQVWIVYDLSCMIGLVKSFVEHGPNLFGSKLEEGGEIKIGELVLSYGAPQHMITAALGGVDRLSFFIDVLRDHLGDICKGDIPPIGGGVKLALKQVDAIKLRVDGKDIETWNIPRNIHLMEDPSNQ